MVFTVNEIKDKRVVDGKVGYFVGWLGFSQENDTWELKEELDKDSHSKRLIEKYEKSLKEKEETAKPSPRTGFDRGLEPSKIMGATSIGGNLVFLIQWKDTPEAEFVPASVANLKCPQLVIKFYEDRLTYHGKM